MAHPSRVPSWLPDSQALTPAQGGSSLADSLGVEVGKVGATDLPSHQAKCVVFLSGIAGLRRGRSRAAPV